MYLKFTTYRCFIGSCVDLHVKCDLSPLSYLLPFFLALMGVAELAKGIQYDKPIKTG